MKIPKFENRQKTEGRQANNLYWFELPFYLHAFTSGQLSADPIPDSTPLETLA
jgi:hypothetical protein